MSVELATWLSWMPTFSNFDAFMSTVFNSWVWCGRLKVVRGGREERGWRQHVVICRFIPSAHRFRLWPKLPGLFIFLFYFLSLQSHLLIITPLWPAFFPSLPHQLYSPKFLVFFTSNLSTSSTLLSSNIHFFLLSPPLSSLFSFTLPIFPSSFSLIPISHRHLSTSPLCVFEIIFSFYNSYFMHAALMQTKKWEFFDRSFLQRCVFLSIFLLPRIPPNIFISFHTLNVFCFLPFFPYLILPRWRKAGEGWMVNAWPPSSSHFQ